MKPRNEFLKGEKIAATEEFSTELTSTTTLKSSIQETYEMLDPKDTEKKNDQN